jgi:hypothetical protein
MFDCLVVNGDSYSAQNLNINAVYADVLGDNLNLPVINLAFPGSSNDRILRSTIEQALELKQQNKNPLVIIGWSFIRRLEVWYYGDNPRIISRIPDSGTKEDYRRPKFVTLDMLIQENDATLEQKCLVQEDLFVHKQLTDFYTGIYMLSQTLNNLQIKWFMFSAAKNTEIPVHCFPYIESLNHVKWCQNQTNIFDLHKFCIMNWSEEHDKDRKPITGHLSEQGHIKFASVLLDWLRSRKIV